MPSPLGHALGGLAAGWLVAGPAKARADGGRGETRQSRLRRVPTRAVAFAALGMAADLDLLIGRHSQFTHSIGMTMVVALGAYGVLRLAHRTGSGPGAAIAPDAPGAPGARESLHPDPRSTPSAFNAVHPDRARHAHRPSFVVLALAVAAAYGSHVLLDWLAQDATPPLGITALWPFSSAYFLSGLDLFAGISRQPWRPGAAWHDVLAVTREVLVLGPLAFAVWWVRRRPRRQILPTATRTAVQRLPPGSGLRADGESR